MLSWTQQSYENICFYTTFRCYRILDKKGALERSINFFANNDLKIIKEDCSKENKDYIMGLSSEKETFIKWFNEHYEGQISDSTVTVDVLYDCIKPYLKYIEKDEWDFKVLIYYILSVDIAIETDRIGMVNHKSDFIII